MKRRVLFASGPFFAASLFAACVGEIADPSGLNDPNRPNDPNNPNNPNDPNDPNDPHMCIERGPPTVARLRRLTFPQYDATAGALLGLNVTPSSALGPEVDGMTPVLWSGFTSQAEAMAASLISDPAAYARLMPCSPAPDEAACVHQFISTVGRRAYRRALTTAEAARYFDLYTSRAELTENGSFDEAIQLILEGMLQSPIFLARIEASTAAKNGKIKLSSSEVATRLSYALWNGPPDDALLDAAERGALDSIAGIKTEAERMLTSDGGVSRARGLMRASSRDYLGMVGAYGQFWSNTMRDPNLFPEFSQGIDVDMREEVLRYVDRVVFDENGSFKDLLTSPTAVVNAKMARIYGVEEPANGVWAPVTLDANERPGLLSRAGFVGTHGRFTRGSLIFRGAFVLRRLLCQELGSPPAGASSTPLPEGEALKTTRQRIDAMTAGQPCSTCHTSRINPAGYALEAFDGIGKSRATDNGVAVDTSGTIVLDGKTQTYDGAKSYAEMLAASDQAHFCYVDRFAQFTFGDAAVDLGCEGEMLATRLGTPEATIKDFLIDFVTSDAFTYRSVEDPQ